MSRPTLLPSSVPFCSVLFLTLATQCLAFPKVEKREMAHAYAQTEQFWKMDTGDGENISAPEHMPQQTSSEAPMVLSAGPSVRPLNKVFSINKEHHRPGTGLLNPNIPDLQSSTEPAVSVSEQGHGPSQLEGMSSEQRLPKALSIIAVSSPTSLNSHQEGPQSSSSTQPIVEGITVVTRDFLKYVDNQLFATESQEAVSLGHTPSSYINTKEMLAASPRTEKAETDAAKRPTAFPGVDSTADTEHDGERPPEESDDNVQTTATTSLETTPEDVLNIDPSADSLLGDLKVTVSVSTAVLVPSVPSDEWDDTKFESVNQARTTDSGDHAEIRVSTEPPHGAQDSFEGTEGSPTSTEVNKGTPLGTALVTALEKERSPVFAHQIPFSPTSLTEDPEVSTVKPLPSAGDFTASTREDRTMLFSKTEVSTSQYESQTHQGVKDMLKDITQEMTMATQEPNPTLPLVTQEHVEVPRGSGEPEDGMPSPSPVSADVGATELSRRWESLATLASTAVVPLSLEVTSSMEDPMDTITGPNKESIPVLGSPEAPPPAVTVETPTISPALPSEGRTISPINHPDTAASYGLEQLESEELEDEEDEEDEDEEEEDEEEDEEDKETDSLYKDFDSDTELPGFTLPGITSQEPDVEAGSMALLEVATYQVPETMEWEQQNQGLGWLYVWNAGSCWGRDSWSLVHLGSTLQH
ncbi:armadillo-like helical domain-containing protein 4 [Microtus ochrogaster]|uniref:Armadillo-like helical domain-containing protein 4 n=1 Tax=Microtus ochrogaster TaxID=79684 RepID=A0ABM1UAM2_MICOH|nr:armadillo-like helical domain-containing protein 4 [Microtus ochrogaster]XP_026639035.1 armadillo-like helical domain-containing protein 4 [Microtus ochrogaster]XP_026639036.1 armadillo-like helical domain-containing protein 4 [Microtus ochrogaster]